MILAKLGRFLEIVALISAIFGLSACESKFSWIKAQYSLASHSRYAKPVETGPTFYVAPFGDDANDGSDSAPFATLERARQVVRGINASMDSDITVYLYGGTYTLSQSIAFDEGDSGYNGHRVVYAAYPGETPVLSGGRRLGGWVPAGNGLYKTSAQGLNFRQLYVNGSRETRARSPNQGSYYQASYVESNDKAIYIEADKIANFQNLNQVEIHVLMSWSEAELRIQSFSIVGDLAAIYPQEPEATNLFTMPLYLYAPGHPYFIDNAMELLDSPGEWYLNTSTDEVFYMPREGEDLSSAEVVAPVVERLLSMQGTHNVTLYGITFEHSSWMGPSYQGRVGGERNAVPNATPTAVYLNAVNSIRFERNTLTRLGASGLGFDSTSSDSVAIGNVITDVSASGIVINESMDLQSYPDGIKIQNNYVAYTGRDYEGTQGICSTFASNGLIEHNEVAYTPYSAIGIGSGFAKFSTLDNQSTTTQYNNIHHYMELLEDGGGVYYRREQPGSFIRENYLHDSQYSGLGIYSDGIVGIYLDDGSAGITIVNNVIEIPGPYNVILSSCSAVCSRDNTVINEGAYTIQDHSGLNTILDGAGDGLGRALRRHFRSFAQLLDRAIDRFARRFGRGDVARLQILERLIDGASRRFAPGNWDPVKANAGIEPAYQGRIRHQAEPTRPR